MLFTKVFHSLLGQLFLTIELAVFRQYLETADFMDLDSKNAKM